jgi:membrane-associated phospholipid phosphatase
LKSFILLLLISTSALFAAEEESLPQLVGNDFISPLKDSYKNYYLYTAGGILLGEFFLQKAEKSIQRSIVSNKPLGASSQYGDLMGQGIPNGIYFLGMEMAGQGHLAGLMLRTSLMSGLTTNILKYSIREKRPDSSAKNSFPSGHTTTAFAFASVVQEKHGYQYGIPAYALATFVGFSRINDNKHYLFDVVAGGLVGTMYGLSICHRDSLINNPSNQVSYNFIPSLTHKELGINFLVSY